MSRYDDLSDRARWFLNNFDEIDLADTCAAQEASNQKWQEVIDRVRAVAGSLSAMGGVVERAAALAILHALDGHDDGPSVQECAKADRKWPLEREGE